MKQFPISNADGHISRPRSYFLTGISVCTSAQCALQHIKSCKSCEMCAPAPLQRVVTRNYDCVLTVPSLSHWLTHSVCGLIDTALCANSHSAFGVGHATIGVVCYRSWVAPLGHWGPYLAPRCQGQRSRLGTVIQSKSSHLSITTPHNGGFAVTNGCFPSCE